MLLLLLLLTHQHVVEAPPRVHQLNDIAVAVHINKSPQRPPCIHAAEENPLVLPIHPKHDVPRIVHIVVHHRVFISKLLRQGLGPEAGLVGEVRTGIFGQIPGEGARVRGGESEPDRTGPALGFLDEADVDLFVDAHRAVGEDDRLAETLHSEIKKKIIINFMKKLC